MRTRTRATFRSPLRPDQVRNPGEDDGHRIDSAIPGHLADRRRRGRYLKGHEMAINAPHSHLYSSITLEGAKAKVPHAERKSLDAPLILVAYIDMLTMMDNNQQKTNTATDEILFGHMYIVLPYSQNW